MSPNPKMERQKSHALLQLQCFLDFTHKSFKLKDLAHSDKINPLFSRFCAREGGGGTPTNSKFKSLAKGARERLASFGGLPGLEGHETWGTRC